MIGPKDDMGILQEGDEALFATTTNTEAEDDVEVENEEKKAKVRRKANSTTVSLECKIGREFAGDVEVSFGVTSFVSPPPPFFSPSP